MRPLKLGLCPMLGVRVTRQLNRQVRAIAYRDGNPLSSTIRRLIVLGIKRDRQLNGIAPDAPEGQS